MLPVEQTCAAAAAIVAADVAAVIVAAVTERDMATRARGFVTSTMAAGRRPAAAAGTMGDEGRFFFVTTGLRLKLTGLAGLSGRAR